MSMKRVLTFSLFLLWSIQLFSKTTYIPTYATFIMLETGSDSLWIDSNRIFAGLASKDNIVGISVYHELVDKEKVDAIKRSVALAGWTTASTVLAGINTVLAATASKNNYSRVALGLSELHRCEALTTLRQMEVSQEKTLEIKCRVENISNEEIMVSDQERGLGWFLKPKTYLEMAMPNPGVLHLRIIKAFGNASDTKYATVLAGSFVTKKNIEYENPDVWIYGFDRNIPLTMSSSDNEPTDGIINAYVKLDRNTFEKEILTVNQGKELIKALKAKGKSK